MPGQSAAEARVLACKRDLHRALYRLAAFEAHDDLGERLSADATRMNAAREKRGLPPR